MLFCIVFSCVCIQVLYSMICDEIFWVLVSNCVGFGKFWRGSPGEDWEMGLDFSVVFGALESGLGKQACSTRHQTSKKKRKGKKRKGSRDKTILSAVPFVNFGCFHKNVGRGRARDQFYVSSDCKDHDWGYFRLFSDLHRPSSPFGRSSFHFDHPFFCFCCSQH